MRERRRGERDEAEPAAAHEGGCRKERTCSRRREAEDVLPTSGGVDLTPREVRGIGLKTPAGGDNQICVGGLTGGLNAFSSGESVAGSWRAGV